MHCFGTLRDKIGHCGFKGLNLDLKELPPTCHVSKLRSSEGLQNGDALGHVQALWDPLDLLI